jgi:hypothetical protein
VLRLAVLAALRGHLSHDRLDAARVAVDEVCDLLLASRGTGPIRCTVRTAVAHVEVRCDRSGPPTHPEDHVRRLLDSLVDTADAEHRDGRSGWTLRLATSASDQAANA